MKDSVTTGNCPWWLTVIGALVISKFVNALSGTWPLFANAEEDCGAMPNTLLEAMLEFNALEAVDALANADEAPACGPYVCVAAEPPETSQPEGAPIPVRMYRSRRFRGVFSYPRATSRITWYWFNCVNIVDTCRWP